jgi:LysM repeat protein
MDGGGVVRAYAAPAAFLLAVTVAVLTVHYTLQRHTTVHAVEAAHVAHLPRHRRVAPPAPVTQFVLVQHGDSFSAISSRTHVSVTTLERLNPGLSPTALHVGQQIRVH